MNVLKTNGFSLLELMVVVVILTIVMSVGVPLLAGYSANQRVKNTAQLLYMDINYARQQAVTKRASVTINARGNSWNSGWRINDATRNQLLKERDSVDAKVGLNANSNSINFNAQGWAAAAFNISVNNRTAGDGCVGNRAKTINISVAGQISISDSNCN